jgi:hypothetical protein
MYLTHTQPTICSHNHTKILEPVSVPILYADDASVLISHANPLQFKNTLN